MPETVFSPLVNYANTKALVSYGPDVLLCCSKSNIVVLKWSGEDCSMRFIEKAHKEWVSGLAVPPQTATATIKDSFVSWSSDGVVKLWNFNTLTVLKAHKSHYTKLTPIAITCAAWSPANPNIVISAGENSCIVKWSLTENVTNKYGGVSLLKASAMACSPVDENVFAFGNKGIIHLVTLEQSSLKCARLRVFQHDFSDLAWQPTGSNPLLAVSSQAKEFSLWDTQERKCVKKWRLPSTKQPPNFKQSKLSDASVIHPLAWASSTVLVSRMNKDLIAFDVKDGENWREDGQAWRTIRSDVNSRDIHAITTSENTIWTYGSDKRIVETDLLTGQEGRSVATMVGDAICLGFSPHDPQMVALGAHDGTVRIWNVNKATGTCVSQTKNVLDRVMSVLWHHTKENCLLYGTSTGRIGIFEIGKPPHILPSFSAVSVYWMCWGPDYVAGPYTSVSPMVLYIVSDKKLFVCDDVLGGKAPRLFSKLQLPSCGVSDISWKPDFSLLAVGCKNGLIHVFKPPSETPAVVTSVGDSVQYFAWHPAMTTSDSELSVYHNLLTCGSFNKSGVISVFKVEETAEEVTSKVFASLKGHSYFVSSVAWSPHVAAQLVSSSADGSVRIWNVLTGVALLVYEPLADGWNYFSFWSPVHSDYIITGNNQSCITWRISTKTSATYKPRAEFKRKKNVKKSKHTGEIAALNAVDGEHDVDRKGTTNVAEENAYAQVRKVPVVSQKITGPLDRMWTKFHEKGEYNTCYRLLSTVPEERQNIYSCSLFGDEDVFQAKMNDVVEALSSNTDDVSLTGVMMWQGTLKTLIERKIAEGGLTEALVGLAPSVSPRLWQLACSAYANQLKMERKFLKAACYLSAARKTAEAIEVLVEGHYFTDALCLARYQLPEDDPTFAKIVKTYCDDLLRNGFIGKAVECLVYLNDYEEVINQLSTCLHEEAAVSVALAAHALGNKELEEQHLLKSFSLAVIRNNLDFVQTLGENHSEFETLALLSFVLLQKKYETIKYERRPLLERVGESVTLVDSAGCYAKISAIPLLEPPEVDIKYSIQEWIIVKELALAASSTTDLRKAKHLLKALEASLTNSDANLCFLCQHLVPDLKPEGLFALQSGVGISLRGFLCLALIRKGDFSTEEGLAVLPQVSILLEDLFDKKSVAYFRAKTELQICQLRLSQQTITKEGKETGAEISDIARRVAALSCSDKVENGASENDSGRTSNGSKTKEPMVPIPNESVTRNGSLSNGEGTVSNGSDKTESSLNDSPKSSVSNGIESSLSDDRPKSNISEGIFSSNEAQNGSLNSSESNSKVQNGSTASDEPTTRINSSKTLSSLVQERNRLVLLIARIEAERTVVPNPILGFVLANILCSKLSIKSETAKAMLDLITKKYLPMIS